jgi:hypothetical protein
MIVSDLYLSKRRCGHTDYMLRAAINDPRVIIVVANQSQISKLKKRYLELLDRQPGYKKLWWFFVGRRMPVFVNIGHAQRETAGMTLPVMCDNLTLIQDHQR